MHWPHARHGCDWSQGGGTAIARIDTTSNILDSAKTLFSAKGYEGTSTREIAEGAGLTVGAIYKHYPSKAALLEEIVTEAATVLEPLLQRDMDDEPSELLYRLTRRLVIFNLEFTRESKIANDEFRSLPEPALSHAIDSRRRIRRIFENAIIDTLSENDTIDRPLVTVLSAIIVGMAATPREWWHPNQQYSLDDTAHIYASVALQCVNIRDLSPGSLSVPLRRDGPAE